MLLRGRTPRRTCQLSMLVVSRSTNRNRLRSLKRCKYGHLAAIHVGQWWMHRSMCVAHSAEASDIHTGPHGAYSLLLRRSNNIHMDRGIRFIYSLPNKNTNKMIAKRTIDSLKRSCQTKKPVRVIRSVGLANRYAPKKGFRYDGLYIVKDHWTNVATCGSYLISQFLFKRCKQQSTPSWNRSTVVKRRRVPINNRGKRSPSSYSNGTSVSESDHNDDDTRLENNHNSEAETLVENHRINATEFEISRLTTGGMDVVSCGRRKSWKYSYTIATLSEETSSNNENISVKAENNDPSSYDYLILNGNFLSNVPSIEKKRLITKIEDYKSIYRTEYDNNSNKCFRGFPNPPFRGFPFNDDFEIYHVAYRMRDLSSKIERQMDSTTFSC